MDINQKPWSIQHVKQEIAYYKDLNPGLANLLDLYEKLLAIEAASIAANNIGFEPLDDEDIPGRIESGEILLDPKATRIDAEEFKAVLTEMAAVLASANPDLRDALDRLVKYPDLDVDTAGENALFIQNLLKFNTQYFTKVAELIDLPSDILFFLIYHALSPFIEKLSYAYRDKIDYGAWQKTFCPVCGRKPAIAYLEAENGENVLQCQICRTQWTYPVEACVVCGNTDGDTYIGLYDQTDDSHLVHMCGSCKKYIKVVDLRNVDREVDLEVEDLVTLHFDEEAKRRGYEPSGRVTMAVSLDMPEDDGEPELPEEITID